MESKANKDIRGKCPECGTGYIISDVSHALNINVHAILPMDECPNCAKYARIHMYEYTAAKIAQLRREFLTERQQSKEREQ